MKKPVYLNEHSGDDKKSGLSPDEAVLTWERVKKISIREGTREFKIIGGHDYCDRIKADAEKHKSEWHLLLTHSSKRFLRAAWRKAGLQNGFFRTV